MSRSKEELTEALIQLGRDEMAAAVADLLTTATATDEDEQYRAGIEDAINAMVQAGATA